VCTPTYVHACLCAASYCCTCVCMYVSTAVFIYVCSELRRTKCMSTIIPLRQVLHIIIQMWLLMSLPSLPSSHYSAGGLPHPPLTYVHTQALAATPRNQVHLIRATALNDAPLAVKEHVALSARRTVQADIQDDLHVHIQANS
ncbi:hypothetical protein VOLCADRAFT_71993, partial [Volvox carteri f. nagariensis]